MRIFFKLFIGVLTCLSLTIILPLYIAIQSLTQSSTYKNSFNEIDFYGNMHAAILDEIDYQSEQVLANQLSFEFELSPELNKKLNDVTLQLFRDLLTVDIIKQTIERNLDHIDKYFNTDQSELIVYIPRSYLIEKIKSQLGNYTTQVLDVILTLPTCSVEQEMALQNGQKVLDCLPSSVSREELRRSYGEEGVTRTIDIIEKLEENDPRFGGSDDITLRDYLTYVDVKDSKDLQNSLEEVERAKNFYNSAKDISLIILLVPFCLLIIFLTLCNGNVVNRLGDVSIISFFAGLFITVPILIARALLPKLPEELNFEKMEGPVKIFETALDALLQIVVNSLNNVLLVSVPMTALGLLIFVGSRVYEKKLLRAKV